MVKLIKALQNLPKPFITYAELANILDGTADSRYGKIKRMCGQGTLLPIRKGLYGIEANANKLHPFELAQYIYGPSYISLESALSFHGLIPENVYSITSVTSKRSKKFNTPLGLFTYLRLPSEEFFTEVELVKNDHACFFMAKPWKAICDFVYCYKKNWRTVEPLVESLRIDIDSLPFLTYQEVESLSEYYNSTRINSFLQGIQNDLVKLSKARITL